MTPERQKGASGTGPQAKPGVELGPGDAVDHGVAFEPHGQDVAGFEGYNQGFAVIQEGERAAPGDGFGKVRHR